MNTPSIKNLSKEKCKRIYEIEVDGNEEATEAKLAIELACQQHSKENDHLIYWHGSHNALLVYRKKV